MYLLLRARCYLPPELELRALARPQHDSDDDNSEHHHDRLTNQGARLQYGRHSGDAQPEQAPWMRHQVPSGGFTSVRVDDVSQVFCVVLRLLSGGMHLKPCRQAIWVAK